MRRRAMNRLPARPRSVQQLSDAELVATIVGGQPDPPGRRSGPAGLPRCPSHLRGAAAKEWRRVARLLHGMGVLTAIDRAALAGYCQAYGRWVEAEEKLQETPILLRTPSGYVQQSPWLGIANKQLELMGRYMVELGMTPASRSRVAVLEMPAAPEPIRVEDMETSALVDSLLALVAKLGTDGGDAGQN